MVATKAPKTKSLKTLKSSGRQHANPDSLLKISKPLPEWRVFGDFPPADSKEIIDLTGYDSEDEYCIPRHLLPRVQARLAAEKEEKMPALERVPQVCGSCLLEPELGFNEDGECGLCMSREEDILNDSYGKNYLAYPRAYRIAMAEVDMEYFGFAWPEFNQHNY